MTAASDPARDLQARLVALRANIGASYADLEKAAAYLPNRALAKQTMSDLLNGNTRPRWKTVETFVLACQRHAKSRRIRRPDSDFDLAAWRSAFDAARASRGRFDDGPLREPYRSPDTAETPVRLLRAEYAVVPFQQRDELTVLLHFCREVAAGDRTGLLVVHGVGGAGKTRLALELSHRLRGEGWYAGVLPKGIDPVPLAEVTAPVAVVLDYADGRVDEAMALFRTLRQRTGPPAVVVLTARSVGGQWVTDIIGSLDDDRHAYRREDIRLPDEHPYSRDIYLRTVAALGRNGEPAHVPPSPAARVRWTTLDLVLLGWIAAAGAETLPPTRADLYDEVLRHEENYWCTVYRRFGGGTEPERAVLRKAAAVVSVTTPTEEETDALLTAVSDLRDDPRERRTVRRTLVTCLCPAPEEGLAVRPDPIGEHLLLGELTRDRALVHAALAVAGDGRIEAVIRALDRAGQLDAEASIALIAAIGAADPGRWRVILAVAAAQSGTAESALERLAAPADTALPLDELSAMLPFSTLAVFNLALIVDQHRLNRARAAHAPATDVAKLLERVSHRAEMAADLGLSQAAITEAVDCYRALAESDSAAHLPDLARSLTQLAGVASDLGQHERALAVVHDVLDITRRLAATNPDHRPDLMRTLCNLAKLQRIRGAPEQALVVLQESVDLGREQAGADPACLRQLVLSLKDLSETLSDLGHREQALAAGQEAVTLGRELAAASPDNLVWLARSLNILGTVLTGLGHHEQALAMSQEAVDSYEELSRGDLELISESVRARSTLGIALAHLRRFREALATTQAAVGISRRLAASNPRYQPHLADCLTNLTRVLGDLRRWDAALAASQEAAELYRRLASGNATHEPALARSLTNLSAIQGEWGRYEDALASAQEAIGIWHGLAATSSRYRPELARSLYVAGRSLRLLGRSEAGHATNDLAINLFREAAADQPAYLAELAVALRYVCDDLSDPTRIRPALDAVAEAVGIYRQLAARGADHVPDLADALSRQGAILATLRRHADALPIAQEAVQLYRSFAGSGTGFQEGLARAQTNLGITLLNLGRQEEALLFCQEAVTLFRDLAAAGTDEHQAPYAQSLVNLGFVLYSLGRAAQALPPTQQAVHLYRELAATSPADHRAGLALALNNAGMVLWFLGRYEQALPPSQEATELYRSLVEVNLGYRPDLARSLTNLGTRLGALDRFGEAIAPSQESVDIRRELADADPAAYLPDLALSLINLGGALSDVGWTEQALAASEEAVELYRRLAGLNPAAYRSFLAGALGRLGITLSELRRPEQALPPIRESVDLHRELAAMNPVAHLPNLLASLTVLSRQLIARDHHSAVLDVWHTAIDAMTSGCARAMLRIGLARQHATAGSPAAARDELLEAVRDLDTESFADSPDPSETVILTGRARQLLRATVHELDLSMETLPFWATAPLNDSHVELFAAACDTNDLSSLRALLKANRDLVNAPEIAASLDLMRALHPDDPGLRKLAIVFRMIAESGIEEFFDRQRSVSDQWNLVGEWLRAATLADAAQFYREHRDLLATDTCRQLLAITGHDKAAHRVAILNLGDMLSVDAVASIVADPNIAEEAALDAIEQGNLDQLTAITAAAPLLESRPETSALVWAIILLTRNHPDHAMTIIQGIVDHCPLIVRRAQAIRLRVLNKHRPELAGVLDLAQTLDPEDNPRPRDPS